MNTLQNSSSSSGLSDTIATNQDGRHTVRAGKKFLVLDLDETLIHCKTVPFDNVHANKKMQVGNEVKELFVSKRPGLDDFVARMAQSYSLVLFTAGIKEYTHTILKLLKIERYFSAVLHRSSCRLNSEKKFEKDLKILGIHPRDIILLDDSVVHIQSQPHNILLIKQYRGEQEDRELPEIATFLEELAGKPDVRPVMENYIKYVTEKESTMGVSSTVAGTIPRNLKVKSMEDIKTPLKSDGYSSEEDSSECHFEDLSENYDGTELSAKVPTLKPQKKSFLSTSKETNASIDSEARVPDDDESTEDSSDELPLHPATKCYALRVTNRIPLMVKTPIDESETKTPASQFERLKVRQAIA